jgi:hypothetical protein
MKVNLLSYTPDALTLLFRTKNTRLKHDEDPATWPEEKRAELIDALEREDAAEAPDRLLSIEAACEALFARITGPIDTALRMANITVDQVNAVELVEGGVFVDRDVSRQVEGHDANVLGGDRCGCEAAILFT